jgi:hypothetical protein
MAKALYRYRLIVNRAKSYVIHAFAASDLNGDGVCNLEEFLILNRHIEKDKYDYNKFLAMFLRNADVSIFSY